MLLCVAFYKWIPQQKKLDSYTISLVEWVKKLHWLSSVTLCDFSFLCVSVCIFAGRCPSALITSAQTQTFLLKGIEKRRLKVAPLSAS